MKKTENELALKKAKDSLKRGYEMTKYAKSAMHPYKKKVFLHEDGRRLCWEDMKSPGELKWILVSDIMSINQGELGKGISGHLNIKNIIKKGCFVLIRLRSKDREAL